MISCDEDCPGVSSDPAHGTLDSTRGQSHGLSTLSADAHVTTRLHHDLLGVLHAHDTLHGLRYVLRFVSVTVNITIIFIVVVFKLYFLDLCV